MAPFLHDVNDTWAADALVEHDDLSKYKQFANADEASDRPVTGAWPKHLHSNLSWTGSEFADVHSYTYMLSKAEVVELNKAVAHFKHLALGIGRVDATTFPLPSLGPILAGLAKELHSGRGFVNIRGLDVAQYSVEDNALLYLGVSSHIAGRRGFQDNDGYIFAHIRDANLSPTAPNERPFRDSNLGLAFHTDEAVDILGLQTLQLAARGGEHKIASSWFVYNELARTRPDLLEALATPDWVWDAPERPQHGLHRPLLFNEAGKVFLNFVRYQLTGLEMTPRSPGLPSLTVKQLKALDAVESIASTNSLVLDLQPGDLTYVNNWAICHSRCPFENDEEHTRHLVRMWLKNDDLAWKLPAVLQSVNTTLYHNERLSPKWNITPEPRISFSAWNKLGP